MPTGTPGHGMRTGTCAAICAAIVVAGAAGVAHGGPSPGGEVDPRAYLMVDGSATLEAETASPSPGVSRQWLPSPRAGSVGGAMVAGPDGGPSVGPDAAPAVAPGLAFSVSFDSAGVYHVWVRGWAADPAGDSLHLGLDGEVQAHSSHLTTRKHEQWHWFRSRISWPAARIVVPSPGVHTVNVWMREDGFELDRLFVSSNPLAVPVGPGPPASPRAG